MPASIATSDDVDWVVRVLMQRREPLVQFAPVFWRLAPDASANHRAFIECLLSDGGTKVYRTHDSVLVAVPRGAGWLVDDAYVPPQLGCPAIVVNQVAGDDALAEALSETGFRRHCDYYTGAITTGYSGGADRQQDHEPDSATNQQEQEADQPQA